MFGEKRDGVCTRKPDLGMTVVFLKTTDRLKESLRQ